MRKSSKGANSVARHCMFDDKKLKIPHGTLLSKSFFFSFFLFKCNNRFTLVLEMLKQVWFIFLKHTFPLQGTFKTNRLKITN